MRGWLALLALCFHLAGSSLAEPTAAFYLLVGPPNKNETVIMRSAAVGMAKKAIQDSHPGAKVEIRAEYDAGVFGEPLPPSIRQVHYIVLSHGGLDKGAYSVKANSSGTLLPVSKIADALAANQTEGRNVDLSFFSCECQGMDVSRLPGAVFGSVSPTQDMDTKDLVRFFGDMLKADGNPTKKWSNPSGAFPLTASEMYRAYRAYRAVTPESEPADPWLHGAHCPGYSAIRR